MEKGICINNRLIEWNRVRSYKWWTFPKKKKGFVTMEIRYSKYFFKHFDTLSVLDEQKDEVDELFKKMVTI